MGEELRIVHLTTVHNPRDNRIFHKECTCLAEAGLDITLIAKDAGTVDVDGVHQVEIEASAGRLGRLTIMQLRAWKALTRVRPQLLHVHDPELIPLALAWKASHRTKVIYDAHEDVVGQMEDKRYLSAPAHFLATRYAKTLVGLANRFADAIVAATPVIANLYTNSRTVVIRNYPWLREYPKVEGQRVPGEAVYIGGLTEGRQFDEMVDSVLKTDGAKLVVAGPPDDKAKQRLAELEGNDKVEYLGVLTPDKVPALLGRASVGLVFLQPLPNYQKSLPTKLFEYMAASVPFVCSNFPYFIELFGHWEAGVFVDSTNPDAVAKVLTDLLANPAKLNELGLNGRRAIETEFNFEQEAPKLVDLTKQLLGLRTR